MPAGSTEAFHRFRVIPSNNHGPIFLKTPLIQSWRARTGLVTMVVAVTAKGMVPHLIGTLLTGTSSLLPTAGAVAAGIGVVGLAAAISQNRSLGRTQTHLIESVVNSTQDLQRDFANRQQKAGSRVPDTTSVQQLWF